jgi:hypothetical protein
MSGPPDSSNHVPTWIFVLLTAIGVPPTVYFALITQHPWLVLLYPLAIGLIYIWQKEFQDSFVKAVAGYIKTVIYFPSRWTYQKYYGNQLRNLYGSVEVLRLDPSLELGLVSLNLEQIFIEPTFVSVALPKEFRSDKNPIWYYLAPKRDSKPLVILGGVGTGKSTLLQYMALTLVDRKKRLEWEVPYKLPFHLSLGLGEFIDKLKKTEKLSLVDAIEVAIEEEGWRQPPSEWVDRRLKNGNCLILLDGLDEVADSGTRQHVVRWIQRQIDTSDNNRFVITSRPFSYHNNPLERVSLTEKAVARNQI